MATSCVSMTSVWNKPRMKISSPSNTQISGICMRQAFPLKNLTLCKASSFSPNRSGKSSVKLSSGRVTSIFGNQENLAHKIPILANQRSKRGHSIQASFNPFSSSSYPPMMKKPKWWWRSLSCLTYFMAIYQAWMNYGGAAYLLYPSLQKFEDVILYFTPTINLTPLFYMAYCTTLYVAVVKKRQWPHFLRFHVIMGLLLDIALQAIGKAREWLPPSVYSSKLGQLFCLGVIFAYVFTVLECMRCALAGKYADVPFASDAAYIQTNVG